MSNSTEDDAASRDLDYVALHELLTAERMGSYFAESKGDLDGAFQLYEWNMAVSAAVMHLTGMVEVVVRNALDKQLQVWAIAQRGRSWLDLAPLDGRGKADIVKAHERATGFGRFPEVHGKVVAELSLGFWRFLVAKRYLTSLWLPVLAAAFPAGPADLGERRRAVEDRLKRLMEVRNRAAHHEPIHRRDLAADVLAAVEIASWVHPAARSWVSSRSYVAALIATRPQFA